MASDTGQPFQLLGFGQNLLKPVKYSHNLKVALDISTALVTSPPDREGNFQIVAVFHSFTSVTLRSLNKSVD